MQQVGQEWTLEELAAHVALLLSTQRVGQASKRVSGAPSPRTIRYYTTRGLVDPPLRFRGRTALYGSRHAAQLVAIKKLQGQGYALQRIQHRLLGLDDASLRRFAGLETSPVAATEPAETAPGAALAGLRLGPRVLLLLEEPTRTMEPGDVQAIRAAAAPLLGVIRTRQLLPR